MEKLGVRMHGVTLTLEASHPPLLAYAAEHLNSLVEAPVARPDMVVKCWWSQGRQNQAVNPFPTDGALNVIGKRMLGNADELIWLEHPAHARTAAPLLSPTGTVDFRSRL